MKISLLFLLVACTLVAAMVPKHRPQPQENEKSTAVSDNMFCAEQTPCAWSIYKSGFKYLIEMNITNTYCVCAADQYCAWNHEDEPASTYVYLCANKS